MKQVVVYEIRLGYLIRLFFRKRKRLSIVFLNSNARSSLRDWIKIFVLSNLSIAQVSRRPLFLRHCQDVDQRCGLSPQHQVFDEAYDESMSWAYLQLERLGLLSNLPDSYIKNLALIIAREMQDEFLSFFRQIILFQSVFKSEKYELHIWQDARLFQVIERREYPGITIRQRFPSNSRFFLNLLVFCFGLLASLINLVPIFSVKAHGRSIPLLCTHRDEFHSDISYRNKLFWFFQLSDDSLKILCLRNRKYQKKFPKMRNEKMSNVIDERRSFSGISRFQMTRTLILRLFVLQLKSLRLFRSRTDSWSALSVWRSTAIFLCAVESNSQLVKQFKVRLYLYEDVYWEVHVFNTLAEMGLIKTIQIQYSNLPRSHINMLSSPSILLAFSEKLATPFHAKPYDVGPKEIVSVGYPLPIENSELVNRANSLKTSLNERGASYIIGFFPESVQRDHDMWAFFSDSDYLKDIRLLSNLVLSNPDIGIILKTQFMKRNPLLLFPDDPILLQACKTGRFLFPEFGIHRNLVTPTEVALASDICIGDIVGATASLEAALAGKRSVMTDSTNYGPKYRKLYFDSHKLVFNNVSGALDAIISFKTDQTESNPIGVWDRIIDELEIEKINAQKIIQEQIISHLF